MSALSVYRSHLARGGDPTPAGYCMLRKQYDVPTIVDLFASVGVKPAVFIPVIREGTKANPEEFKEFVVAYAFVTRRDSPKQLTTDQQPQAGPDHLEVALEVMNAFIESVKTSGTLMPDDRVNRDAVAAATTIARESEHYAERLGSKLLKVGARKDEVEGFIRAVERQVEGRGIRLLSFAEIMAMPDPMFLIEGLIEERGLAVLYSLPKLGKTFIVLDWCLCVATGRPWLGRPVIKGPVVYVCAEGVGGLPKRYRALYTHYGLKAPPPDFYTITRGVNLLDTTSVAEAIAAVEALDVQPALIVLDTYARSMVGGEENSAKDTGRVIEAFDRLRFTLNSAVLCNHHTGKDGGSERGSGALRGAADTMLMLNKGPADSLLLTVDDQKNFAEGPPIALRLEPVGDSLVPVEVVVDTGAQWEMAANSEPDRRQEKWLQLRAAIMAALEEAHADGRAPISQNQLLEPIKGGSMGVKIKLLHELADDPESRVVMEAQGNSKLYSLLP